MGKLHIVGSGAIGSLIAASAQKNGVPYDCYPRNIKTMPAFAQWQDSQSIALKAPMPAPVVLEKSDVLILPLKVYQLNAALIQWLPCLTQKPTVVMMHNGMGGLEVARDLLGRDYPLLLATTSHGALKESTSSGDFHVKYTGLGATQIGAPNLAVPPPQKLADLLQVAPQLANAIATLDSALPPVQYQSDILRALWTKLSVNAVINPLTALHNIQNKHIADAEFEQSRHAICREFTLVAKTYGLDFTAQMVHENVLSVAKATGENYSSMHQDVAHGRQTEIEAINGYIVEMAKKKGIPVPENTLLLERVKALSV
ncbi:2-dehydropantoate 2-reductase [Alteromonas sp. ALT199]|uniref:ketopantoate reductase family protein n=1 Tax=unclassified Alteromonas TaxID=2614992 RepID=UPI001BE97835|nr:2-dehydropantoate 2-reductase [Alteromonas sp. ALT199]MBT3133577.1 2-dehydropantoate 2-reductase [Alteromonas sp. ALT199]